MEPERDESIVLVVTLPDRTLSHLEAFYSRLDLEIGERQMTGYAATLYFDPQILEVVQVIDVPGSIGAPHAAASNSVGFVTLSESSQEAAATGRVPLAEILWRAIGPAGSSMTLDGHASIIDISTGEPVRVRYSAIQVNRGIEIGE